MRRLNLRIVACLVVLIVPGSVRAESRVRPFSRSEKLFIAGTGLTLGLFEVHQRILTPKTCRWCEPNGFDDSIRNSLRRDTRSGRKTAARWSDLTGFGSGFLMVGWTALAAREGNHEEIETNSLTIVESAVVALSVSHVVKRAFARERPYRRNTVDPEAPQPDDNMSFFSGHTALGFAVATSAGRIADIEGYRCAPAVWATGLTLAAATGYFRIASDKHYFTDVVAGAVTGSAVGLILAHRRIPETPSENASRLHLVFQTDGQNFGVALR